MGRAQKLKKQRKADKIESERNRSEKMQMTLVTVVTIIIFLVAGFFITDWYRNKSNNVGDGIVKVVMHTNKGDVTLGLDSKVAPKTVENFVGLTKSGYYNGTTFHRVIADFMIQGGDPGGDGFGGESTWGGKFEDEINALSLGLSDEDITSLEGMGYQYRDDLQSIKMDAGVIAMANSGPNTNGSQFFIVTKESQPHLDGRHTVFGRVIDGMDVVLAIANTEVDQDDKPLEPVVIESIEVLAGDDSTTDLGVTETDLPVTNDDVSAETDITSNPIDSVTVTTDDNGVVDLGEIEINP